VTDAILQGKYRWLPVLAAALTIKQQKAQSLHNDQLVLQ
jgi:hypothetical protein